MGQRQSSDRTIGPWPNANRLARPNEHRDSRDILTRTPGAEVGITQWRDGAQGFARPTGTIPAQRSPVQTWVALNGPLLMPE